jgi:tetratricopeptide (TPR) repeat protein
MRRFLIFKTIQKILVLSFLSVICMSSANASNKNLDELFFQLKNSTNESDARLIEQEIWNAWIQSGDAVIDALMKEALRKRRGYDFNGSIEILNKVIELKPDFSEAWNQRATVYFNQEKYEESLMDIAKVLELEPRHFGSLAGRAVIRIRQFKNALARQSIQEALKYHPFLRERSLFPDLQ